MLNCIVLAGGLGKRYNGKKHKLLTRLKNKNVIDFALQNSIKIANNKIICVTSNFTNDYVKKKYKKIICVSQKTPNGTGEAAKLAIRNLKEMTGLVMVLYGDMPLIKLKTLKNLLDHYNKFQTPFLSYFKSIKKIDFGIIETNNNNVVKVTEFKKHLWKENKKEHFYNGGFFICEVKFLDTLLKKIKKEKKSNEYLLTDIFSVAYLKNKPFKLYKVSRKEMYGVNTQIDLKKIENFI